jgi:toxin ParE1/3/4
MAEKIVSLSVVWSERAVTDLLGILDFIAQEHPASAEKLYHALKKQCQDLCHFPLQGRLIPELKDLGVSLYRELVVEAYRVVYRVDKNSLLILMIVDSRRDLESLLFDLLIEG